MASTAKQIDFLLAGYRHPTTDEPLNGGKVKTYLDGTSTLSSLWTDKDKGGSAANPIVLDSAGQAEVYGDNIYKFEIYDSDDVLLETINGLDYGVFRAENYIADSSETDQGSAGNGNSVKDLVDSIGSSDETIYLPASATAYTFSTDETIPSNIMFKPENGANISIDSGVTLTIGKMDPVNYQVFSGDGSVVFSAGAIKYVRPEMWGVDGTADDVQLQQASDSLTGGGHIFLDATTYNLAAQVTFNEGVYVEGVGRNVTILNATSGVDALKWTEASVDDANHGGLSRVTLRGSGAATLLEVQNIWGFSILDNHIFGNATVEKCIVLTDQSFEADIRNNRITDFYTYGIEFATTGANYSNSVVISNNDFSGDDGGTGIYLTGASSVKISDNHFELSAGYGGHHIEMYSTKAPKIYGNHFGSNAVVDNDKGSVHLGAGTWLAAIFGNKFSVSDQYGVAITGAATYDISLNGNIYEIDDNEQVGQETKGAVFVDSRPDISITGEVAHLTRDAVTNGVFHVGGTSTNVTITGCTVHGSTGTIDAIGVQVESGSTGVNISGCTFRNMTKGIDSDIAGTTKYLTARGNSFSNVTTPFTLVSNDAIHLSDNIGYLTEAHGSGTIASGTTTVNVAHGLPFTPISDWIAIQPGTPTSTNDPGPIWVHGADGTNIEVRCRNDPGASGAAFTWQYAWR